MKRSGLGKILFAAFSLSFAMFVFSCDRPSSDGADSYERSLAETAPEAARLDLKNQQTELGRFIEGTWRGNCHPDGDSLQEKEFQGGRAKFTSYFPGVDGGSGFEHGLYEVVSDTQIHLLRMSVDDFEIRKLGENSFTILENGSQNIYYGCTFTRQ